MNSEKNMLESPDLKSKNINSELKNKIEKGVESPTLREVFEKIKEYIKIKTEDGKVYIIEDKPRKEIFDEVGHLVRLDFRVYEKGKDGFLEFCYMRKGSYEILGKNTSSAESDICVSYWKDEDVILPGGEIIFTFK